MFCVVFNPVILIGQRGGCVGCKIAILVQAVLDLLRERCIVSGVIFDIGYHVQGGLAGPNVESNGILNIFQQNTQAF